MITTQAGKTVQPGDFAAVRVHGRVGVLIEIGETLDEIAVGSWKFGNWEHAIFYAGDDPELGSDLILEAEPGGARLRPFHFAEGDVLWSTDNPKLDLNTAQRQMVMNIAKHYKGTPYSAADYFALAARRLLGRHLAEPLRHYVASTGHMICSQLADQCRLEMGSHLFDDGRWPGYVTPLDLANLITS